MTIRPWVCVLFESTREFIVVDVTVDVEDADETSPTARGSGAPAGFRREAADTRLSRLATELLRLSADDDDGRSVDDVVVVVVVGRGAADMFVCEAEARGAAWVWKAGGFSGE